MPSVKLLRRAEASKWSGSSTTRGRREGDAEVMDSPPRQYHREKLVELAPYFWGQTDSSDCTIVILHGSGREITHNLHLGYVASQSSVILNGFMGRSSPRKPSPSFKNSCSSLPPSPPPSPNFPPSPFEAKRVLSCEKPTLRLSLPDPTSFGLIVHFLYWGDASFVREALDEGRVCGEGLMKNLIALEIESPLKVVVGKWWIHNKTDEATRPSSLRRAQLLTPPSSYYDSDSNSDVDSLY